MSRTWTEDIPELEEEQEQSEWDRETPSQLNPLSSPHPGPSVALKLLVTVARLAVALACLRGTKARNREAFA